jgi:hypothetical protein
MYKARVLIENMDIGRNPKASLREYSKPLFLLVVTLVIVNCLLIYFKTTSPGVFYAANAVAYYMVSLFFIGLNNRVRITSNTIGIIIFLGFWIILLDQVVQILNATLTK